MCIRDRGGGDHGHHCAEIPQGRRPAKTHGPAADDHSPPSGKVEMCIRDRSKIVKGQLNVITNVRYDHRCV